MLFIALICVYSDSILPFEICLSGTHIRGGKLKSKTVGCRMEEFDNWVWMTERCGAPTGGLWVSSVGRGTWRMKIPQGGQ